MALNPEQEDRLFNWEALWHTGRRSFERSGNPLSNGVGLVGPEYIEKVLLPPRCPLRVGKLELACELVPCVEVERASCSPWPGALAPVLKRLAIARAAEAEAPWTGA